MRFLILVVYLSVYWFEHYTEENTMEDSLNEYCWRLISR